MQNNGITVTRDENNFKKLYNRDKRLTLKAKGLLGLVLDLPRAWDFSIAGLISICKEEEDAIRSGIRELNRYGYVEYERVRNETGQLKQTDYHFYENPEDNPNRDFPDLGNPDLENPNEENPAQYKSKDFIKENKKREGAKSKDGGQDGGKKTPSLPNSVLLWLSIMQIEITEAGANMIARRVSIMDVWQDTLEGWLASGWTKNNIDGQLNRYDKKVAEGNYRETPKVLETELSPEEIKLKEMERELIYGKD